MKEEKKIKLNNGDALILVDVQTDFFPGGALPVPEADPIVSLLNVWIRQAQSKGVPVLLSRDFHPTVHPSFKKEGGHWPPHCLQDQKGAAFHDKLKVPENAVLVTKGVRLDKDQNSAFDETGLDIFLRLENIKRVFIGGLALDICVKATVLDAVAAGFEAVLIKDATRPLDSRAGEEALAQMEKKGVRAVLTSEDDLDVCTSAPEWAEHARPNEPGPDACDDGRGF